MPSLCLFGFHSELESTLTQATATHQRANATPLQVVWQKKLANPVPAASLPCGNISPFVGVTSTPVIDPASGALVVSAKTLTGSTQARICTCLSNRSFGLLGGQHTAYHRISCCACNGCARCRNSRCQGAWCCLHAILPAA